MISAERKEQLETYRRWRRPNPLILKIDKNQKENLNAIGITYKDCIICLDPIKGETLSKNNCCKGQFHSNCLAIWKDLRSNCPLCRKEFYLA